MDQQIKSITDFNNDDFYRFPALPLLSGIYNQPNLPGRLLSLVEKGRVGLVLNMDGTLSALENVPAEATVSTAIRTALATLQQSERFEVIAVLSGRSARQSREVVGLDDLLYIGNYGMETLEAGASEAFPIKAARPYASLVKSALEAVRHQLLSYHSESLQQLGEGDWQQKLVFENKDITAAIHYRQCINHHLVRPIVWRETQQIAARVGLRVRENRKVIEIYPPVETNKGTTLRRLSETYRLNSLIYLGDDVTDLDAFQTLRQLEQENRQIRQEVWRDAPLFEGLTIGVCSAEMSPALAAQAEYLLDGVGGVEQLLTQLVALTRLN